MAIAAPTYSLLIDGTQYAPYLEQDTWTVSMNYGRQGTTASFQLLDDFTQSYNVGEPTYGVCIVPLTEIIFQDTSTGALIFAGYNTAPNITWYSPGLAEWSLPCVDYTLRSDNIVVIADLFGLTADVMIKTLLEAASASTITGDLTANGGYLAPGPALGRLQFDYTTLSQAITKIARLSSQQTDFNWYIDNNRQVHFISLAQLPTPTITFSDYQSEFGANGSNIGVNFGTFRGGYNDFSYVYDGSTIRNSAIVQGSYVTTPRTDWFVGNGVTSAWALSYVINSVISGAATTSSTGTATTSILLYVNGALTNVSSVSQGNTPVGAGWYYTQNQVGTWILVAPSPPTPGTQIEFQYTANQPIITQQDNNASQVYYGDSHGRLMLQTFVSDTALTSLSAAIQRGQGELQEYQWAQERVTLTTNESWPGHISTGDTFYGHFSRVLDSQNSYSIGLTPATNAIFLVVQCNIAGQQGNFRQYTITACRVS
jgi:hypothetical protein